MIIRNRYSGEVYKELQETGTVEVKSIIRSGKQASENLGAVPGYDLSQYLHTISDGISRNSHDLSRIISIETGKPVKQSRQEVERSTQAFRLAAEEIKNIEGASQDGRTRKSLQNHIAFSSHFPVGLILSFHPFTEPLYSVSTRVAASLATGNAVVVKPSTIAPLSSLKLLEIIEQAGLPENSAQAVIAGRDSKSVRALLDSDSFGLATFSGRGESAHGFTKRAGLRKTLLETGSSSPVIVWDDADLDDAAESIANSAFSFQGQAPVRAQSIFVKSDSYEYIKNRLIELTQQLKNGDPLDEETDYGPLIDESVAIETEELVNQARENAGYVLSGSGREGAFYEPTILENIGTTSDLVRKQILAPVITLHQVDSFSEALKLCNETGISNQSGIFTSDINLAMTAVEKLNCGTVSVNDAPGLPAETIYSPNPRGNLTASKSIRYLMRNMTEEKLALLRR